MSDLRLRLIVGVFLAAGFGGGSADAQQATAAYTTYTVAKQGVSWITCGSTSQTEGCYGSGMLQGFGKICAVLQGAPVVNGHTTKQKLYVIDSNFGHKGDVYLRVFDETVVTSSTTITTAFTSAGRVALGIPGGEKVSCSAAANASVIAAGTSTSPNAVVISKKTLAVAAVGGFSPPENVSSIVADANGYIAINQGTYPSGGFTLLGPDGSLVEDGGGNVVVFNTTNAYLPQ